MYAKAFKTEDEWNARNIFKYFYDSYSMGHTAIIWKIIREWVKSIFEFEKSRISADRSFQGYNNTWSTKLKRYAAIENNVPLTYPKGDSDVTDLELPFWRRITDPAWVETYVHILGKSFLRIVER